MQACVATDAPTARQIYVGRMPGPLTALDGTFLELEQMDEGATMHIGGVMIFEALPDGEAAGLDSVRAEIASRLTLLPRYTQRLSSERVGGLSWPRWEPDPHFDVANHVGRAALPAPGGEEELCEWTADYFSHRLDRTRPLWEMVLVEGLSQGRWALVTKTHHCLVDGVGSVGVAHLLLDVEPSPAVRGATETPAAAAGDGASSRVPNAVSDLARTGRRVALAGARSILHPGDTLARSRSLAGLLVRDELIGAPTTSLNTPIGAMRRYRVVRVALPELKAIGRALEGSVNDVVLAGCTAGLRRMLLSRGEEPPSSGLRAMVPMNTRGVAEQLALGNRVSSLFVELPVAEDDPFVRLGLIVARTRKLKTSGAALGAETMLDIASLAPPVLHAPIAKSLYATRLFNLTITNVPGPRIPLYAFGAAMVEVLPLVPLAARHAVGIAVLSYNGEVVLGLSADRDTTPDLDVLADGIREGFEELRILGRASATHDPASPPQPAAAGRLDHRAGRPGTAARAAVPRAASDAR